MYINFCSLKSKIIGVATRSYVEVVVRRVLESIIIFVFGKTKDGNSGSLLPILMITVLIAFLPLYIHTDALFSVDSNSFLPIS